MKDRPDTVVELRARALQLLARREHSRQELGRKLSPNAESRDAVEALLDDLQQKNHLSEERFAESRARILARKYGAARIRQDLKAKGVGDELLAKVSSEGDLERAQAILARKYREPAVTAQEKAKRMRFLQSRGFSTELIRKAVAGIVALLLGTAVLSPRDGEAAGPDGGIDDAALLAVVKHGLVTSSSPFYNINIENIYGALWRKHGARGVSPVVLEIGPGTNMAQGVAFVMRGARRYYGLDIYRDPKFYEASAYQAVAELIAAVSPSLVGTRPADIFSVAEGAARFNPDRMAFLYPHQSFDIPLPPNSVDYVFSNAVFEHVEDPDATIKALDRVLRKGALTVHQIDMRDHRDYSRPLQYRKNQPLEYLKVSPEQWSKDTAQLPAYKHENRWRLSQFRKSFERNGFAIIAVDAERMVVTEALRRSLHPEFQKFALDDLAVIGARIVARKR